MFSPIFTMFTYFPLRAWITVLILLLISWYAYRTNHRKWKEHSLTRIQAGSRWLLVSYILLLLFFTVLGRRSLDCYRYNFNIGYSFRDAFYNGTPATIKLIVVNVSIFVPVGFLGTLGSKRLGLLKSSAIGVMLTSSIEVFQLLLRNGTCEIDDLISNTLGTLLGIFLALLLHPQFQYLLCVLTHRPTPNDPRWVCYEIIQME